MDKVAANRKTFDGGARKILDGETMGPDECCKVPPEIHLAESSAIMQPLPSVNKKSRQWMNSVEIELRRERY